jgi:3-oxoacyl-[acyl-carrier-protein] synthase-3
VEIEALLKYARVCLEAFGYALPEGVVSSAELERELSPVYERFGLHQGRLELMTGIKERRFWDEGTSPSDGSTRAGRRALEAAGVEPSEIECLIHGAVSRDFLEPATASIVHDNLGVSPKSIMYDISNACLGFMNGMISLANMIELGQVRRGLIVAGESSRQLVRTTIERLLSAPKLTRQELKVAFASLTIGSGAVALVMADESVAKSDHRLLGGAVRSATQHNDLCRGSADTGFAGESGMVMQTDSEQLLVSGCELAKETWADLKQALQWDDGSMVRSYCHQVGATHRDKLYEAIGVDPHDDFSTFEFLGNVGSVSLPLTLALGIERQQPSPGDQIAMLGIGSGLSCVMLGVKW